MRNKRNRRSRRLKTPSPDRDLSEMQVETSDQGNETLTTVNTIIQKILGGDQMRPLLVEPSQSVMRFKRWTENFEQMNNDRILKIREEMENNFEAILKGIRTSKSASTITNPRSETNGTLNSQPSGSRNGRSDRVHASNVGNSDTEDEDDHPLRASDMRKLRNPARPLYQNAPNQDETIKNELRTLRRRIITRVFQTLSGKIFSSFQTLSFRIRPRILQELSRPARFFLQTSESARNV